MRAFQFGGVCLLTYMRFAAYAASKAALNQMLRVRPKLARCMEGANRDSTWLRSSRGQTTTQ